METKYCNKCGTTKELSEFHKNQLYCKDCKKRLRAERNTAKPSAVSDYNKRYYSQNKESESARRKARYYADKESAIAKVREWQAANPQKVQASVANRYALKRSAFVENVTVAGLRERDGDNCYLCSDPLDFESPRAVHIEHKTPLSRGGEHSYANTALACAGCNLAKGAKTLEEYLSQISA